MIDILVISHACFRRANRLVYNYIANNYNLRLEIIAPETLQRGEQILKADFYKTGDVKVHFISLKGQNPRTYDFEGLYDLLGERKPKFIYLDNDPVSVQAVRVGIWASQNNSKLVCLSCENLMFDIFNSFKRLGFKGIVSGLAKTVLLQLSRKNIDHVFTINDAGTAFCKKYNFKSVSKTPLGVDTTIFTPNEKQKLATRDKLGIDKDTILFAYIGRTVHEKGIHILLEALANINHNKDWVFMLDEFKATKTPYQLKIVNMIKDLELENKVIYFDAGHLEISKYMNAADVIIMPSISTPQWVEQYGRVAPEGMACGTLIVASNVGALPELIGDAGILFEEGNKTELTSVLQKIIMNKELPSKYADRARQRAEEKLSIKVQASNIFHMYNQLIV
jgi:glycosyltransferase involved in cell wall biosynthesis